LALNSRRRRRDAGKPATFRSAAASKTTRRNTTGSAPHVQAGLLFLATIALLVPWAVAEADSETGAAFTNKLSVGLAVLLIATYGLGMLFSLKTHREFFGSVTHREKGEEPWPIRLALVTLTALTVLVALVSEYLG
jgi:Ca2+:H+ antiporter